jgi:hypothetical protein
MATAVVNIRTVDLQTLTAEKNASQRLDDAKKAFQSCLPTFDPPPYQ